MHFPSLNLDLLPAPLLSLLTISLFTLHPSLTSCAPTSMHHLSNPPDLSAFRPAPATQRDQNVGIGISLSPTYGTIAASFPDGHSLPLARIDSPDKEGGKGYREAMRRLFAYYANGQGREEGSENQHPSSDSDDKYGNWKPLLSVQQLRRSNDSNTDRGKNVDSESNLPPIYEMLSTLDQKASEILGYHVTDVAITSTVSGLELERGMLEKALEKLGWNNALSNGGTVDRTWAAYAGMGGACVSSNCMSLEEDREEMAILRIDYSEDALDVSLSASPSPSPPSDGKNSLSAEWTPIRHTLDFGLGHNALLQAAADSTSSPFESSKTERYWENVRWRLRTALNSLMSSDQQSSSSSSSTLLKPPKPQQALILLTGNLSHDVTFRKALEQELAAMQMARGGECVPKVFEAEDPVFVGAKGAASIARWAMEKSHNLE
ncbi:MAG: hypothetical protein Q9227_005664 [Pyrenula ochraceoflavens]